MCYHCFIIIDSHSTMKISPLSLRRNMFHLQSKYKFFREKYPLNCQHCQCQKKLLEYSTEFQQFPTQQRRSHYELFLVAPLIHWNSSTFYEVGKRRHTKSRSLSLTTRDTNMAWVFVLTLAICFSILKLQNLF
jgi:hypothetical protein